MPWVEFVQSFDFSPKERGGRVTIAYAAGSRANVTRECLAAAKAAGAVTVEKRKEASGADENRHG